MWAPALSPAGELSSGALIAFILYIDLFFSPIQQLSQVFDVVAADPGIGTDGSASSCRLETGRPRQPTRSNPGGCRGALSLEHVHFSYPSPGRADELAGAAAVDWQRRVAAGDGSAECSVTPTGGRLNGKSARSSAGSRPSGRSRARRSPSLARRAQVSRP